MWTLTFKDKNDATITVEIGGGNGTLTGAAEPLITRELETDDPFEPVRYQTGYINLVGTDGADIRPADTFDRPVTIKKNGSIVWLGYIAVEEWNGSMTDYPKTVSLPLISALGVLDYVKYPAENANKTVGQILHKALSMAQVSWNGIYYGIYSNDVFRYTINDQAFANKTEDRHKHYDGINPDMPKRDEEYKALDVVREICKAFGWVAREDSNNVWLCSADAGASYSGAPFYSLQGSMPAFTYVGVARDISPASMDQTKSKIATKNQVRIAVDCHPMNDTILSLDNVLERLGFRQEWNCPPTSMPAVKYYFSDLYNTNRDVAIIEQIGQSGAVNMVGDQLDARSASDLRYKGAVLCKDTYIQPRLYKESDTETKPCLTITNSAGAYDVAKLFSEDTYFFAPGQDGNIDLVIKAEAVSFWDELRFPTDEEKNKVAYLPSQLTGKLKFGDVWFNGTSWQSAETTFHILETEPASEQVFPQTWRHNCKGKRIPLPTGHSGRFMLVIQTPAGDSGYRKYIRFNEVSLTLVPWSYSSYITERDEMRYNAECNSLARDSYQQDVNLFFKPANTNMYVLSQNSITMLAGSVSPMAAILSRMQTWYSKAHMRLQVNAIGTVFQPMDTATYNSYNCFIGARQVNWRDAQTRLTLYSL